MPDEIDILRALAHPVRWGILTRLAAEPGICACDFTEFFDVSQPTISAHLKVLREAGLVATQRRGTTICYTLTRDPLARLADRLSGMGATAPAPPATAPPVTVPPTAAPPVTAPPTPAPPATAPASVA